MNKTEFTYCPTCGYPMTSENNEVGSSLMRCRHCDLFTDWKRLNKIIHSHELLLDERADSIKELNIRLIDRTEAFSKRVSDLVKDNSRLKIQLEELQQENETMKLGHRILATL